MPIEGWPILLDICLPPPYPALRQEGTVLRARPVHQGLDMAPLVAYTTG